MVLNNMMLVQVVNVVRWGYDDPPVDVVVCIVVTQHECAMSSFHSFKRYNHIFNNVIGYGQLA